MINTPSRFIISFCVLAISLALAACSTNALRHTQQNKDWPSYGRDYAGQRFSPLEQINESNVKKLALAWQYKSGISASFQVTPLVVDKVMYLSLPYNHVVALDATNGKELWRYQHDLNKNWKLCCGPANRGVAVSDGKVFVGTIDARLIALDAKTGQKLWDINVVDTAVKTEGQAALNSNDPNSGRHSSSGTGAGISMAPVVYKGKVIIGITGVGYGLHIESARADIPLGTVVGVTGRYGRPGFLAAFDVNTGKRIWQFDTIPAQGWEGQFVETTSDGIALNRDIATEKANKNNYKESWSFGGGSAWSTPAIDSKTDTLFFGTGNPSPQMEDDTRPGDNLYTVSLVALDANTGKIKWYYQQVPHDVWGYDTASPPVLFNWRCTILKCNGKIIPVVGQASKTGWYYVNDRVTGELLIKSEAFVPQLNLFARATKEGVTLYPGILGGASWSPSALDEAKQLAYVAAIHAPIKYTLHDQTARPSDSGSIRYISAEPTDEPRWGLLSAIDLSTGKIKWQNKTEQPLIGGVLATQGNLLFMGEGNGNFNAYQSQTGDLLWTTKIDAGVNAPPITYAIDGVQYVAVAAGGNAIFNYKSGDIIAVYVLPKK